MSAPELKVAEEAADIAWEQHAANVALVRRVTTDPGASDAQRRRAVEMAARSERTFKDRFLALDAPAPAGGDAEIAAAWADWTAGYWKRDIDADPPAAELPRGRECERIFTNSAAGSPRAVAILLRVIAHADSVEPWQAAAALGAAVPDFAAKLAMDDFGTRILWNAISALERMGVAS